MRARKIIGRMPKSYKIKETSYPFDAYGDISDFSFADQLLLSPEIDDQIKETIRNSFIIDATPVSDYYYTGTDQEYWQIDKDFPNLAPPYESFFLEFKAPLEIVSCEFGRKDWDSRNPVGWGLLCQGIETAKLAQSALDSEEQKLEMKGKMKITLEAYRRSAESIIGQYPPVHSQEDFERVHNSLKPAEQTLLANYRACREMDELLQNDQWEKFEEMLSTIQEKDRWLLNMTLFTKYISEDEISCDAPTSFYQLCVQPNGRVGVNSRGVLKAAFYPFGSLLQDIDDRHKLTGRNKMDLLEEARGRYIPFYNAALLTISFLHCKNVSVQEAPKPQISRLSKAQPQLTYHTIDIAPMRRVLQTEGGESANGTKKALHICRGHFASYENGRGLFGKYKGTFWIPQHIRGQAQFVAK